MLPEFGVSAYQKAEKEKSGGVQKIAGPAKSPTATPSSTNNSEEQIRAEIQAERARRAALRG